MEVDPVLIAQLQFAFTAACHVIFLALSIGLSVAIAALLAMWARSGEDRYQRLARFWARIFAVALATSIVSGIALSQQFNSGWSQLAVFSDNILGPPIDYGVTIAFVTAGACLGVLLLGWDHIPRWLQATVAIVASVGVATASFWALAAYSWMHTPTGHTIVDGVAMPSDWWIIIFNPSFPYRFAHVVNASLLTTGFVVLAVGARYLLADRHPEQARIMMTMAVTSIAILAPAQMLIGNLHGHNTLKHQPIKVAAMEAHWDSDKPVDFHILAWPDNSAEINRWALSIPNAGSLVLTHRLKGQIIGLKDVAPQNRPPVKTVFFAFRTMIAVGLAMIAASLVGAWLLWRGMLFETRWYLRIAAHAWWCGFVATIAGWIVTESGHQPWAVQGILRSADAITPLATSTAPIMPSLLVIGSAGMLTIAIYAIVRLIALGPQGSSGAPPARGSTAPPGSSHDPRHRALASGS